MFGLIETGATFFVILVAVIIYFKWSYNYWARKGVPYIQPSIPWGTSNNPITTNLHFSVEIKNNYDELKSQGHIYGGLYIINRPALLAVKPDFIKRILMKDFQYFSAHAVRLVEENDPISDNLFSLDGEKWRSLRSKLTPTFTSGKMKMMFPTLLACGDQMIDYVNDLCQKGQTLDIKEISARFTTDVIGSCVFGIDCNSFKHPEAKFRRCGKQLFDSWKNDVYRFVNSIFKRNIDNEARNFLFTSFKNIVKQRLDKDIKRNDFLQLLLNLQDKPGNEGGKDGLTMDQMAAQAMLFFVAGFETSSTTMTFCFLELAYNLDIQERVRKEIIETMDKFDGKLTYDAIMEMKYLDMVVDETLRKYPPGSVFTRLCTKDYTIEETGAVIEKGTMVLVSVLGLHRDPEYFPNPDKFDPERFSDENMAKLQNFTYMPFGDGPRICIGIRFGLMQVKVGLCLLLKNFIYTPHKSMQYEMGGYHKSTFVLSFKDTLLLNVKRIE